jgi:cystathionine beta-lyase
LVKLSDCILIYKEKMEKSTIAIHSARKTREAIQCVNPPIHKTSTIIYDTLADFLEAESHGQADKSYGRGNNPNNALLAEALRELEGSHSCFITSTGLIAIIIAIMSFATSGSTVLIPETAYGCTKRFAKKEMLEKLNINVIFYNPVDFAYIEKNLKKKPSVILLESPGSGTFEIQDIPAICKIAQEYGVITVLDNSWSSSLLFNAFDHGVDISAQSLTKYVNGHSDLLLGAISCNEKTHQQVYNTVRNYGCTPSPEDSYLALRGLRTLPLRLKAHQEGALKVAQYLEEHPDIEAVIYPALPSHPQHEIWLRDFKGASSVFCVVLKTNEFDKLELFCNSLQLFAIGLSWGGYESLLAPVNPSKSPRTTPWPHKGQCVRLHIGLEDPDDLIADLMQALRRIS